MEPLCMTGLVGSKSLKGRRHQAPPPANGRRQRRDQPIQPLQSLPVKPSSSQSRLVPPSTAPVPLQSLPVQPSLPLCLPVSPSSTSATPSSSQSIPVCPSASQCHSQSVSVFPASPSVTPSSSQYPPVHPSPSAAKPLPRPHIWPRPFHWPRPSFRAPPPPISPPPPFPVPAAALGSSVPGQRRHPDASSPFQFDWCHRRVGGLAVAAVLSMLGVVILLSTATPLPELSPLAGTGA
ncbi:uncharacterized protein [Taeniopygia guttata]|uniref:uncharacterized protein n=1 Tax=Taeniopygia guttata TaxID=59729 RepID=UPI003BB96CE8